MDHPGFFSYSNRLSKWTNNSGAWNFLSNRMDSYLWQNAILEQWYSFLLWVVTLYYVETLNNHNKERRHNENNFRICRIHYRGWSNTFHNLCDSSRIAEVKLAILPMVMVSWWFNTQQETKQWRTQKHDKQSWTAITADVERVDSLIHSQWRLIISCIRETAG